MSNNRQQIRGAIRRLHEVRARVRDNKECSALLDSALAILLRNRPAPAHPCKDPATGRFMRLPQ